MRNYFDSIDIDPLHMQSVEERFSQVMSLAKKHHVLPEDLYAHHQELSVK
ncbi:DNA repair protein recN [Vibrio ishigakensis]|uniref:DNA repair protein recN n=1 Tax=Vibrio ishigakensis TaxID=1481914 RepID=A0A0B8P3D7_9VIBR|nr:DNA repair protein recN [Vibrio ishigakensis]